MGASGPECCLLTSTLGSLAAYLLRGTDKHVPSGAVTSLLITCARLLWHFRWHRRHSPSVLGASETSRALLLVEASLACRLLPVGPWALHKIVCHPVLHPVTGPCLSQKPGETLVKEGRKYPDHCTLCGVPGLGPCPSCSLQGDSSLSSYSFPHVNCGQL